MPREVLYYNLEKQEDKEKTASRNMNVWKGMGQKTAIMENGNAAVGKNSGKPQRYKGSCKLAFLQFLVFAGADQIEAGKMEPSARKITDRRNRSIWK